MRRARPATPTSSRRRCSPSSTACRRWRPGCFDPEIGIDFARLVHGGQEFTWGELVVAGDEIATTVTLADVSERAGNGFFAFESRSVNQDGAEVSAGRWTNIVRGA